MALWFDLKVNHAVIGRLVAVRQSPPGQPEIGQTCTYRWDILRGDPGEPSVTITSGTIDFPYSDGFELVGAILAQAGRD